jgi:ATP-binding protein involved in chromosome partitioning
MTRIAVPLAGGQFSSHFGGADTFALYAIEEETRVIISKEEAIPPPHERGVFPMWLRSQGATTILAGGMGPRAVKMFQAYGIAVVMGIEEPTHPDELVRAYLSGTLRASGKGCGGDGLHHCHDDAP